MIFSTIQRNIFGKKIEYTMDSQSSVKGFANHQLGFMPTVIQVEDGEIVYVLKQENWFLKLLNYLPIFNLKTFTPFHYYQNQVHKGKTKTNLTGPVFWLHSDTHLYEIRLHNKDFISLMKNQEQVALYEKEKHSVHEGNTYHVRYLSEEITEAVIMMFCVFADVMFYKEDHKIAEEKYETNIVFKDKYKSRTQWGMDTK